MFKNCEIYQLEQKNYRVFYTPMTLTFLENLKIKCPVKSY